MATTYTDNGSVARLEAGDTRFYRVSTINSFDTSPASTSYSAVTGTSALSAPTGLGARNSGQKHITLTWTAATTGAGYRVERSEDGRTGWAMVGTGVPGIATTTYIDADADMSMELSTRYHYRVSATATSPNRRSRPSNVANATTGPVMKPEAPTALMLTEQGPSRIDLLWTAPTETGGGDITGYKIEYSNSTSATPAANTWRDLVANLEKTKDEDENTGIQVTYTDDGSIAMLSEGNQRHYRVSAINSAGAGTASDPMRSAITPLVAMVATSAPKGLMATAEGPTQIDLSWTAPTDTSGDEITGYQIQYADLDADAGMRDLVANTGNDKTTYTDDGSVEALSAMTTRQYRVSAINVVGPSPASNVASATTAEATVPGKPTTLRPDGTGAEAITLTWTAPVNTGGTDITGYRIERSESMSSWPAKPLVANHTPSATPETYSDTMVPKANTRWYYRVSAINAEGTGMASDAAFVHTRVATAPGAPTDLTAWEEGPTRIVLQWQAPAATGGEITGYKIEYSGTTDFANADPGLVLVENTRSMATTYTDNGSVARLEAGDTRFYRVSTINSFDTSPASTSYSAVTGTMAPTLTVDGPVSPSYMENGTDRCGNLHGFGPRFGHGHLVA